MPDDFKGKYLLVVVALWWREALIVTKRNSFSKSFRPQYIGVSLRFSHLKELAAHVAEVQSWRRSQQTWRYPYAEFSDLSGGRWYGLRANPACSIWTTMKKNKMPVSVNFSDGERGKFFGKFKYAARPTPDVARGSRTIPRVIVQCVSWALRRFRPRK